MNSFLLHASIFLSALSLFVIFMGIYERRYWLKHKPEKAVGIKELSANYFLGASYKLIDAAIIAIAVIFFYDDIKAIGLRLEIGNSWWEWCIAFLFIDLCFYVVHFAMHKVRWFWTSHVTHHSSDRYNFSVALRQNFTVALNGTMLIIWIPAALIGFDINMALLALEINLFYQFLLHTEMPSPLDRLGIIMNTPSHHRVHHGCKPDQIDTNFGGTFIIWDRLFGTFKAEKEAGEIAYGITRCQPNTYNPLTLLFHEWKDMLTDLITTRDLRVLWKNPGWIDQHPRAQHSHPYEGHLHDESGSKQRSSQESSKKAA